jgi:hypothetical protein
MTGLVVRPAQHSDLPDCHPKGVSYRAWSVDLDGEFVGILGLAYTRPRASLFCWIDERLRPHLKHMTLMRLLKRLEVTFKERGLPVCAIREKSEDKAFAILTRLGLRHVGMIGDDELWLWHPNGGRDE